MFKRLKNAWTALRTDPDLPALNLPSTTGLDIVRNFTTDDEPKVVDYPKGKYFAYWEIVVGEVPGGYSAVVRFYPSVAAPMLTGQLEYTFVEPRLNDLKPQVNSLIRTRMEDFKR